MNKICYFNLATFSSTGGIENFNKSFLNALNSYEDKKTVVSVYDSSTPEEYSNLEINNFNKKKLTATLYVLKNIFKVEKLILAHLNLLPISFIAKLLNPKLEVYLCIYGIEVWKKLSNFQKKCLKNVKILSISSYTSKLFVESNNLQNSEIIYFPPDTKVNVNNDFANVYPEDRFNILSVSRLDSSDNYKGIDTMIETVSELVKDIPNLLYTIIGKGDDKDRLEKMVSDLGLQDHVQFKGFVEYIEPYYKYCDIFSLPSKGEGFGIVYIEAMKYKKPCIACNIGGQTDVVKDQSTGYLCEYGDKETIADRVLKLFNDAELRSSMGLAGHKHLMENFTFEKFKNRVGKIINV